MQHGIPAPAAEAMVQAHWDRLVRDLTAGLAVDIPGIGTAMLSAHASSNGLCRQFFFVLHPFPATTESIREKWDPAGGAGVARLVDRDQRTRVSRKTACERARERAHARRRAEGTQCPTT